MTAEVQKLETGTNEVQDEQEVDSYVPSVNPLYVTKGCNFKTIEQVVNAKMFSPTYIFGPTGCGKTTMIEQACAKAGRELIRVNITGTTDEFDLLGSMQLKNDSTFFKHGMVPVAMKRGAVLLLDELDLASPAKIMCLQPVMEGSPLLLKKTGEVVQPKEGFTIIATGNTKAKGDESGGKYIGTNVLNSAFLDRIDSFIAHDYPTENEEIEILHNMADHLQLDQTESRDFIAKLVKWVATNRSRGGEIEYENIITTRGLLSILRSYKIFGDRKQAIKNCISKFNDYESEPLMEHYKNCDPSVMTDEETIDNELDVSSVFEEDTLVESF